MKVALALEGLIYVSYLLGGMHPQRAQLQPPEFSGQLKVLRLHPEQVHR